MRLTEVVHKILTEQVCEGELAIDATAGNGHDTLFLAELVGESGKVIAIDIQASAINITHGKLCVAGLEDRVSLQCADHAIQLEAMVTKSYSPAAAIVFNLGYLPGSDKTIQTRSTSTSQALDAAARLLRPNGHLCVTAYRGHPGGPAEAALVEEWMRRQQSAGHEVESYVPPSNNNPPILWVLAKQNETFC